MRRKSNADVSKAYIFITEVRLEIRFFAQGKGLGEEFICSVDVEPSTQFEKYNDRSSGISQRMKMTL